VEPTIKQLRYFVTVAETGSFRRAAARLGVSQPTLTAQIATLEKTLDCILLERTRQGTSPSALGRTLLPHIHALLNESREIANIARDSARSPSGTHRLGVPYTLGPYLLPDIIPEIHRTYPSLRIFVKEDTPSNLELGLQNGLYDIIFTPLPLDMEECVCEPLFSEPLQVVAPPDHPLVGRQSIMPPQFEGENFLVIEERHRFFSQVQKLAAKFGFRLLRDFEGTSLDTLRQMIGTGLGLSFLPALYIRSEITPRNDVAILHLGFDLPQREIALAWRLRSPQKHVYQQITRIIRDVCRHQLAGHVQVLESTNT
jgi:LysR family transcriptional regulator, hydrogen peroxide-inducible genes activator